MRLAPLCLVVAAAGCTAGGTMMRDGGRTDSSVPFDAGMDAGPRMCTGAADCDDGHACTLDNCVVGSVCGYTPIDAMCNTTAGERCVIGRGCVMGTPTECMGDGDCDDGLYCNGVERCLAMRCAPAAAPVNCNDGNDCTIDMC